jgi:acyl-CoA synthetase (AMP-forming)/AMP-acid ligase II
MLAAILDHESFARTDISSLRYIVWGGGQLQRALLERWMSVTSADFSTQFGMTETNGPIAWTPPTRDIDLLMNTVGKMDSRLEWRVVDNTGAVHAMSVQGEIQVRLPFPFAGYIGEEKASAEAFTADGFVRTGDLGLVRDDGYLEFRGRAKEMYKSGGFNVYPREVELAIEGHPDVRAAAIVAVDDEKWGQVGIAFVELVRPVSKAELVDWCKAQLANYKIPKSIEIVDAIPRISVDKIDRRALQARLPTQK